MKKLLFVSTGRCGTTRIAEILKDKLPCDHFTVVHQMRLSRLGNVIGNLMYYCGGSELIKQSLYSFIISKYARRKHFVSTDPLTAMIIPTRYAASPDVCIVHILRDDDSFAASMLSFSRCRLQSMIAHNLIPLWQPGLWPFENLLNKNIRGKYKKISDLKNNLILNTYSHSENYIRAKMTDLFATNMLQEIVNRWFDEKIEITTTDLKRKANESRSSSY